MKAALTLDTQGPIGPSGPKWPDQEKARKMGADRLGMQASDPRLSWKDGNGISFLELLRRNGFSLFISRSLWGYNGSPEGMAALFRDDMKRLDMYPNAQHGSRQCALNADLEVDDPGWVLACLKEIRRILSGRGLTWSHQPHKGGIYSRDLIDFINGDPAVTVAPFLYGQNMEPYSERYVFDDLNRIGVRADKILSYYGSYSLGWNGFLYDLDNIK